MGNLLADCGCNGRKEDTDTDPDDHLDDELQSIKNALGSIYFKNEFKEKFNTK